MARGNGEGTIYKRKDGTWCGQLTIGLDPKTGKPKRKTVYGKQRKEVAKKLTDLKMKLFDGLYSEQSEMKLANWLTMWNEGRKSSVTYNTYRYNEKAIRLHINPSLGELKLKNLKARHAQNLINDKLENGRINGEGGLSHNTVRGIFKVLNAGINQAIKENILSKNTLKAVELPKEDKNNEMKVWNKNEVNEFLNAAKNHKFYLIYYIALNTGMRRGELAGLKWSNVDLESKKINVRKQIVRTDAGRKRGDTKTMSSKRTIPLTKKTVRLLQKHRIQQAEYKLALGKNYNDNDFVFCDRLGNSINPPHIYGQFKKIIAENDLPDIRLHDLRHTFATLFLEAGGPIKVLQSILGHASITQTIDRYAHVTKNMLDIAVDRMEEMYKIS
jgi:integrase